MKVANICTRKVAAIAADSDLHMAAELMRKRHVGSLVVLDDEHSRQPVGMITDRDLVVSILASHAEDADVCVRDVMSRRLATCRDTDDPFDAVKIMQNRGVRRLPVVDARGDVVGLISADDLIETFSGMLRGLSAALGRERANEIEHRA